MEQATLQFLRDLQSNNNKEWMDANRKRYEAAKQDFEHFVAELIGGLGKIDPALGDLQAKKCIFRLNRDIRFSKDKSPYKTNFGAAFSRGGKNSAAAAYYFHLEPGASFAGGGIWMPEADRLRHIRQEIDYNFDEFKAIVQDKKFKKYFPKIEGDALTRPPKGYDDTNPAIAYLKLKSFTVGAELPDKDLTAPALQQKTLDIYTLMQPFIQFLNRAVE